MRLFANKTYLGIIILLMLPLLFNTAFASVYDERHIELLAVQTLEDGSTIGKSADLYLQVRDGAGRVFLDTTPLTKVDTQATTRYAKDMACEYFSLDCDKYDFFFTIRSDTNIVGGPSAGAATAAITAITIMDLDHDEQIAVTGSINSGGTIGPVGGVKSKIEAASDQKLSKVLVPQGSLSEYVNYDSNKIIDWKNRYSKYGKTRTSSKILTLDQYSSKVLGIEAIEIGDLSDLLYELSNVNITDNYGDLEVDEGYTKIMQGLDKSLCDRTDYLVSELMNFGLLDNESSKRADEIYNSSKKARNDDNFYASASACFSGNVFLKFKEYELKNLSQEDFNLEVASLRSKARSMQEQIDKTQMNTIYNIKKKMVVNERLNEALEFFDTALNENNSYALAYGNERILSAQTWSKFFELDGKNLEISEDTLLFACHAKMLEAEERYSYSRISFPGLNLEHVKEKIDSAKVAFNQKNPELCLVQAAQAKAEASSVVSSVGLGTREASEYLESKEEAVLRILGRNTKKDQFPILGYSYYLFAKNLAEENTYSSLLYYEYALEMSELNIYFPEEESGSIFEEWFGLTLKNGHKTFFSGFFQGLLMGILLMWLFFHRRKK